MDIRPITDSYAVSPQIAPEDMAAIKAAGYVAIINNRPDAEIPPEWQATAMEAAAKEAGLDFVVNPVTHAGLNMDMVATQMETLQNAGGPVLAYCASGTRSSIVWSLGMAKDMSAEEIMQATGNAGYDLSGLVPQLNAIAGS